MNTLKYALTFLAVLPLVLYVAAYFAMLDPQRLVEVTEDRIGIVSMRVVFRPKYRWGGDMVYGFFAPILEIDKKLRPTAWEYPIPIPAK